MSDSNTIESEFYLFGINFEKHDQQGMSDDFSAWPLGGDFTTDTNLKNVRPIPFTPILKINQAKGAEQKSVLWGSNEKGQLCQLAYPKAETEAESLDAPVLFRHSAGLEPFEEHEQHQLLFPPIQLLGQLAHVHHSEHQLVKTLTDMYGKLKVTTDSHGEDEETPPETFGLAQISVDQLAPAYEAKHGSALTREQVKYNDWLAGVKASNKVLKGIIAPSIHAISVVFSSDTYVGAEVSLVKPVDTLSSSDQSKEQVLARAFVEKPEFVGEEYESDLYQATLPSVVFNLPPVLEKDADGEAIDPVVLEDGHLLLRVKFWSLEYLELNKPLTEIPQSILSGQLKLETNLKRDGDRNNQEQNVYSYELYEKLTFKTLSGGSKLAVVCGDLISLEECLIYQFPDNMPSYQDYRAASDASAKVAKSNGLNTLTLASAVQKFATQELEGFAKGGGNPFMANGSRKPTSAIMFSVAKGIWGHIDKDTLPPSTRAAGGFLFGLMASKDAYDALQSSLKTVKRSRIVAENVKTGGDFIRRYLAKNVVDTRYAGALAQRISKTVADSGFKGSTARLAQSWMSGSAMKRVNNALPLLNTGISVYQFGKLYKQGVEISDNLETAKSTFENLCGRYVETISLRHAYQDWAQTLLDSSSMVVDDKGNQVAHVVAGKQGIAIHVYFQFNSWEHANDSDKLRSDIKQTCTNIAQLLIQNPSYQLLIEGHAAQRGNHEANDFVAEKRALAILEAIIDHDQELEERIVVTSHGKRRPLTSDDVAAKLLKYDEHDEYSINRRVELRLVVPNYSVSLPPSRSGMIQLEQSRQYMMTFKVGLDENQRKRMQAIFDGLMGVASITPLAPAAATYLMMKAGAELANNVVDAFDDLYFEGAYGSFKSRVKNVDTLKRHAELQKQIISAYREIDEKIEQQALTSEDDVVKHLTDEKNAKELQKRFLLRALALNALVELLARLSLMSPGDSRIRSMIQSYRVEDFIETYITNDNWEIPRFTHNTLAQNWINRATYASGVDSVAQATGSTFLGHIAGPAVGKFRKFFSQTPMEQPLSLGGNLEHHWDQALRAFSYLSGYAAVQGNFNKGFPIQTKLYTDDTENGLLEFARTFDNNVPSVNADDIGFSRLLVQQTLNDETSWVPLENWLRPGSTHRITPFTRVKIQVVLTKKASTSSKPIFKATLDYRLERIAFDVRGPAYELLLSPMELADMTQCEGDYNQPLEQYYSDQFRDEPELGALTAVEFEPTYWFGLYEIPGLKPLYPDTLLKNFERWSQSDDIKSMPYFFTLNQHRLDLSAASYQKDEKNPKRLLRVLALTNPVIASLSASSLFLKKFLNQENNKIGTINFGIDSTDVLGKQCELINGELVDTGPDTITLFDGVSDQPVVINEADLLVEDFVKSTTSQEGRSLPGFFKAPIAQFGAIQVDKDFCWFDRDAKNRETSLIDWGKSEEQKVSLFTALVCQETSEDDYAKMKIPTDFIQMQLNLQVEKENRFINDKTSGQNYTGWMVKAGYFFYTVEEYNSEYAPGGKAKKAVLNFSLRSDLPDDTLDDFITKVETQLKGMERPIPLDANVLSKDTIESIEYPLYVMRIDLEYVSPTGKKVQGLRPFGCIVEAEDTDKEVIHPCNLTLGDLHQVMVSEKVWVQGNFWRPIWDGQFEISGHKTFYDKDLAWMQTRDVPKGKENATQIYWQEQFANNEKKAKKYVRDWITKQPQNAQPKLPGGL
ncbi:OmpA family protein [Vibrio sp. WXL210]|uniref:OmpA family protein n=1 Tax=Vibrio sp. WXL210 TaxID=3450709 RepID=UPI003EC59F36